MQLLWQTYPALLSATVAGCNARMILWECWGTPEWWPANKKAQIWQPSGTSCGRIGSSGASADCRQRRSRVNRCNTDVEPDNKLGDQTGWQFISSLRRPLRSWCKFLLSLSEHAGYDWRRTLIDYAVRRWKLSFKTNTITWQTVRHAYNIDSAVKKNKKSICEDKDAHIYWPELWLWNFLTERQKDLVYKCSLARNNANNNSLGGNAAAA